MRLIRRVAPALPVHGSTQMSITSAEGAEFARALGVERVVVGRELSVADIARVGAESHAEVEAFVHGALCVSYRCPLCTASILHAPRGQSQLFHSVPSCDQHCSKRLHQLQLCVVAAASRESLDWTVWLRDYPGITFHAALPPVNILIIRKASWRGNAANGVQRAMFLV